MDEEETVTKWLHEEMAENYEARIKELDEKIEDLHTWKGLMSLLDEHWPDDIFVGGGEDTDVGVKLVVALRKIDEKDKDLEEENARLKKENARLKREVRQLQTAVGMQGASP